MSLKVLMWLPVSVLIMVPDVATGLSTLAALPLKMMVLVLTVVLPP